MRICLTSMRSTRTWSVKRKQLNTLKRGGRKHQRSRCAVDICFPVHDMFGNHIGFLDRETTYWQ